MPSFKERYWLLLMFILNFKRVTTSLLSGLLLLSYSVSCAAVHAGVISYSPGTGGTFDPDSASTFTAMDFGNGGLSGAVGYDLATVFFTWGGTETVPEFSITGISASIVGSTVVFGDVAFATSTPSGQGVLSNQVIFSPPGPFFVPATDLSSLELTFTLPELVVADGWFLTARFQFSDDEFNTNPTSAQTFTAASQDITPVPEPSSLIIVGLVGSFAAYRVRRKSPKAGVGVDADETSW